MKRRNWYLDEKIDIRESVIRYSGNMDDVKRAEKVEERLISYFGKEKALDIMLDLEDIITNCFKEVNKAAFYVYEEIVPEFLRLSGSYDELKYVIGLMRLFTRTIVDRETYYDEPITDYLDILIYLKYFSEKAGSLNEFKIFIRKALIKTKQGSSILINAEELKNKLTTGEYWIKNGILWSSQNDEFLSLLKSKKTLVKESEDLTDILCFLSKKLRDIIPCHTCIIFIGEIKGEPEFVIKTVGADGIYAEYALAFKDISLSSEDIIGWVASEKKSYFIKSIQNLPFAPWSMNEETEIAVPLISNDKCIGVIYTGHSNSDFFTQEEFNFLETLTDLICSFIIMFNH